MTDLTFPACGNGHSQWAAKVTSQMFLDFDDGSSLWAAEAEAICPETGQTVLVQRRLLRDADGRCESDWSMMLEAVETAVEETP